MMPVALEKKNQVSASTRHRRHHPVFKLETMNRTLYVESVFDMTLHQLEVACVGAPKHRIAVQVA